MAWRPLGPGGRSPLMAFAALGVVAGLAALVTALVLLVADCATG